MSPTLAPLDPPTPEEVHVWVVDLDQPDDVRAGLRSWLSPDERVRAERFHFDRLSRRYETGRGAVRVLLGRYLGEAPGSVAFEYGPHGKPALATRFGSPLRFSIAHCEDLLVCAVAVHRDIGVDVEALRVVGSLDEIAERFFSARETAALRRLPDDTRHVGFLNCWTCKEAYLKALGDGLTKPLDEFDVSFQPNEPVRLLHVAGQPGEAARWSLETFVPRDGFVGAVATTGGCHVWQRQSRWVDEAPAA